MQVEGLDALVDGEVGAAGEAGVTIGVGGGEGDGDGEGTAGEVLGKLDGEGVAPGLGDGEGAQGLEALGTGGEQEGARAGEVEGHLGGLAGAARGRGEGEGEGVQALIARGVGRRVAEPEVERTAHLRSVADAREGDDIVAGLEAGEIEGRDGALAQGHPALRRLAGDHLLHPLALVGAAVGAAGEVAPGALFEGELHLDLALRGAFGDEEGGLRARGFALAQADVGALSEERLGSGVSGDGAAAGLA